MSNLKNILFVRRKRDFLNFSFTRITHLCKFMVTRLISLSNFDKNTPENPQKNALVSGLPYERNNNNNNIIYINGSRLNKRAVGLTFLKENT